MIAYLEHELEKKEDKFKEAKEELGLKQTDLNALENLINQQVDEINILKDNNYGEPNCCKCTDGECNKSSKEGDQRT